MTKGDDNFDRDFEELMGHPPFPWQRRLYSQMVAGQLPSAIDIPTGLGKTAVMTVWLLARASCPKLPRRLVYIVDRRAVVDQATDEALKLRQRLDAQSLIHIRSGLGLAGRKLPVSTLRGKHVDNREWLEDPTSPAIVVGTVDMVGSRLLFEGYGVSRRMRPFQAGLLGCDTLWLLDEAHLSGPFESLLKAVETESCVPRHTGSGERVGQFAGVGSDASLVPPFNVLPLSATLGSDGSELKNQEKFVLGPEDWDHPVERARLEAPKALVVEAVADPKKLSAELADRAWDLMVQESRRTGVSVRVVVYCHRRVDAEKVGKALKQRARKEKTGAAVILFVGGRRIYERMKAARTLQEYGLLANSEQRSEESVFLVATSAAEVGVDLDADHMVCDLVPWERMVQRLGRVNRRGAGSARIVVVDQGPPKNQEEAERLSAVRELLDYLPLSGARIQACPSALVQVGVSSGGQDLIRKASTPMPLTPPLTRPLVDSWSLTSLAQHSGRPELEPWLRGWQETRPQTTVVWRRHLPVRVEESETGWETVQLGTKAAQSFFEAAPPHSAEQLETETENVAKWLKACLTKLFKKLDRSSSDSSSGGTLDGLDRGGVPSLHRDAPIAFLLDKVNELQRVLTTRDVEGLRPEGLRTVLAGTVVVVDARVRGLADGLLDTTSRAPVPTPEDDWGLADESRSETEEDDAGIRSAFTVRAMSSEDRAHLIQPNRHVPSASAALHDDWRETWAAPYVVAGGDEPRKWLVVGKRLAGAVTDEESRGIAQSLQELEQHQRNAASEADRIATRLELPDDYRTMLVEAARHHDEGKRATRWQRAFNAPSAGGPYAKTPGPLNRHVLAGYRHEVQSVLDAIGSGLADLTPEEPRFDLALHLIAAHHGFARPSVGVDGCDTVPPTVAKARAHEIAARFARLQRQWGPWGLAWWEALLRSADQRASRT